jgi:cytoskeletal protein CcmA (bactofilin family)
MSMFAAKQSKSPAQADTVIGSASRIEGNVRFSGGLRVDGTVTGNIVSQDSGTLIVSEQAVVEGEIRVAHAIINGKVIGPIHASESLELHAKARVSGDIHYGALEVHLGAIVQGRLVHGAEGRNENVVSLMSGAAD